MESGWVSVWQQETHLEAGSRRLAELWHLGHSHGDQEEGRSETRAHGLSASVQKSQVWGRLRTPRRWPQVFPSYLCLHSAWQCRPRRPHPWACESLPATTRPPGSGGGAVPPVSWCTSRLSQGLSNASDMVRIHSCVFLPSAAVIKKLHFHLVSHFSPLPASLPGGM